MKLRWVPAVLVAVVGGAVLSGCGTTQANSPTTGSSGASPTTSGAYGALGVSGGVGPSTAAPSTAGGSNATTPGAPSKSAMPSSTKSNAVQPVNTDTASSDPQSGGTSFTVPAIPGNNIVSAYGSYTKVSAERVKVTICAKQTGTAFSVGALALAYNAAGASKNVGAVVLNGPGDTECGTMTFLFYGVHLKVHAFIGGNNGMIETTGPVLTLY